MSLSDKSFKMLSHALYDMRRTKHLSDYDISYRHAEKDSIVSLELSRHHALVISRMFCMQFDMAIFKPATIRTNQPSDKRPL